MRFFPLHPIVVVGSFACAAVAPAHAVPYMIQEASPVSVSLSVGSSGASELSGLTWLGGTSYLAVSDDSAAMYPLTIAVDLADGTIDSASVGSGIALAGSDLEGIAFVAPDRVLVSDEVGPNIRLHAVADGGLVQTLTMPAVLGNVRGNLGLEALAWDETNDRVWTANEEALSVDGPVSSFSAGTVVRLTRFNAAFAADGQWAYVTDAIPGDRAPAGRDVEVSGVPALAVLSDGTVLVLERALGNSASLRHRIYQVDYSAATDVSSLPALDGAGYTPVTKTLLWERNVIVTNFEGMALGPTLADGSRSLILVSDNGSSLASAMFALKVRPLVCGDGVEGGDETCDDGNTLAGDGCDATCGDEFCGDGLVNDGGAESCEDGNAMDGDGCDANCNLESAAVACQRAVAKAGAAYAKARLGAEQKCRNRLNRGAALVRADDGTTPVTDPADCSVEEDVVADSNRAGAKARATVAKKCNETSVAALAACADTVDGLIGPAGQDGCLVDVTATQAGNWLAAAYGAVVPLDQGERRRCQEALGKAGLKYLSSAMKALAACRNGLHDGKSLYFDAAKTLPLWNPSDCDAEYAAATKTARAGGKLRAAVADRCTDAHIAALATLCAATVDGLVEPGGTAGCLVDTLSDAAGALLASQYGL